MCFIRSSFISGVNIVLIVSMSSESRSLIVHWNCYDLSKFDFENKMDGKRCHWSTLGSSLGSMSLSDPNLCTKAIAIRAHLCPWRSALGSPPSSASQRKWLRASRPTNQHSPETNETFSLRTFLQYMDAIPSAGCFGRILGGCRRFRGCLRSFK